MTAKDYKLKEDSFYEWKGVKPPERQPHLTEEEVEERLANNLAGHKCHWIQRGNRIECNSGDYAHGKVIDVSLLLTGTGPEGEPLLQKIVIQ